MNALRHALSVIIGFGSGVLISGAVFAFITIVGIVPRLAQKTHTARQIKVYESAIAIGGVFGAITGFFTPSWTWGLWLMPVIGIATGIFYGCLAMSLAEVLDVIPILTRRARLQRGMFFLVMAIALGKLMGALLYFFIPGFYDPASM
ncbi:MAG: stage V sporulation protein AB [Defluviitaleaceae bacterium]|nr:stage V sporulation protein AB [Defluviitaleaceae bacterium]MCL2273725.1 stage V sporulation protein AB [Defluviitaleaceae bacterium]